MGHSLTDNRHGLVVNAMVTHADGYAEREAAKAMIKDARQAVANPETEVTLGADKGYAAAEFIEELKRLKVTPHVAQSKSARRSAVPDEIATTGKRAPEAQNQPRRPSAGAGFPQLAQVRSNTGPAARYFSSLLGAENLGPTLAGDERAGHRQAIESRCHGLPLTPCAPNQEQVTMLTQ